MYLVVTGLAAAVALACPSLAAAESTVSEEGGAVLEPIATSPSEALAFWTRARREAAEPLPIVTVPGSAPEATATTEGTQEAVPTAEGAAAPGIAAHARTAAIGGTEVNSTESTVFPNSANGKVLGVFNLFEEFECSGSVVAANVVLTAGHCVIDPATGAHALYVVFIPGYNDGSKPHGETFVFPTGYAFTKSWEQTAKAGSTANEGNDLAFLKTTTNVEKAAGGSLGIAFDQPCNQTYTQYGYPAEEPYNGKVLYSNTAAYAGPDTNPNFSPTPMKIASDFTKGASGGPWTVGPTASPTVLSVTAYGYENQPGYLYGPYFGESARKAYELALGKSVPVGIEEVCKPLEVPKHTESTPTQSPAAPASPSEAATPASSVELRVTRVRHRANGSAVLIAKVSAAGKLKLTGAAVRAETVNTQNAGKYRLVVAPKGRTGMRLRRKGRAKVGVKVAFSASGKTRRVSRSIRLTRREAGRPTSPPARRSG
ncbi:MAG TPA: trypsin-like serine protease [Solirubrobacterales bacterium]|nr:trypsin-like serine protease [Solirubrobacterales bacterium]